MDAYIRIKVKTEIALERLLDDIAHSAECKNVPASKVCDTIISVLDSEMRLNMIAWLEEVRQKPPIFKPENG